MSLTALIVVLALVCLGIVLFVVLGWTKWPARAAEMDLEMDLDYEARQDFNRQQAAQSEQRAKLQRIAKRMDRP